MTSARSPFAAASGPLRQDVPIYMEWIGSLDGNVNAVIRPQVTGYLIRQNYREGDLVKQGQPLFEIDPRTFEAAVDEARGCAPSRLARFETARPTSPASSRWRP
jgi:membrane fusion protein (multidrug efflux system)